MTLGLKFDKNTFLELSVDPFQDIMILSDTGQKPHLNFN